METVTLSSTFQVDIPETVRKVLDLSVGQQFQVVVYHNRIELIPLVPLTSMRGFLHGIDTIIEREQDRF